MPRARLLLVGRSAGAAAAYQRALGDVARVAHVARADEARAAIMEGHGGPGVKTTPGPTGHARIDGVLVGGGMDAASREAVRAAAAAARPPLPFVHVELWRVWRGGIRAQVLRGLREAGLRI